MPGSVWLCRMFRNLHALDPHSIHCLHASYPDTQSSSRHLLPRYRTVPVTQRQTAAADGVIGRQRAGGAHEGRSRRGGGGYGLCRWLAVSVGGRGGQRRRYGAAVCGSIACAVWRDSQPHVMCAAVWRHAGTVAVSLCTGGYAVDDSAVRSNVGALLPNACY